MAVSLPNGTVSSEGTILIDYTDGKITYWCDLDSCPEQKDCEVKGQEMTFRFAVQKKNGGVKMPKCSFCKKEIDYLYHYGSIWVANKMTLNSNDYPSYKRVEEQPRGNNTWSCPECEAILSRTEREAIKFLEEE